MEVLRLVLMLAIFAWHILVHVWIQGCGTERNGIDRQWSVYHTRSIVCPRHILLHVHIRILRHEVFREERAHDRTVAANNIPSDIFHLHFLLLAFLVRRIL